MNHEIFNKAVEIKKEIVEEESLISILEELKKNDCVVINSYNDSWQYGVTGEEKTNKTLDAVIFVHMRNIERLNKEFNDL